MEIRNVVRQISHLIMIEQVCFGSCSKNQIDFFMRKIVIPIIITSAIIPMIIIPIVEEVPKLITSNKHDYDSI